MSKKQTAPWLFPIKINGMSFVILSRLDAEVYECDDPHLFISITCPGDEHPKLPENKNRFNTLCLNFNDTDEKELSYSDSEVKSISSEQAESIAKAVKNAIENKIVFFIVNCDAGVSRSSGTISSIAKYCAGDDEPFFTRGYWSPNMHVYMMILEALRRNDD